MVSSPLSSPTPIPARHRYSQGVELLHNVECREPRKNQELAALLDALFTNQVRALSWTAAVNRRS